MKVGFTKSLALSLIVMSAAATLFPTPAHAELKQCDGNDPPPPVNDSIHLNTASGAMAYASPKVLNTAVDYHGSTPAEIHAKFSGIIEANFITGSPEHVLSRLSDKELADLAAIYSTRTNGQTGPLLKVFAARLSDKSLLRVASAFGATPVQAAVRQFASPAVQQAFASQIGSVAAVAQPSMKLQTMLSPMAAPTTDMTIQEIYLEFRTAPVGSLSATSAISETAIFAATRLSAAGTLGYTIGSGISYLITNYAPNLSDAIGGTVSGMVDQTKAAGSELVQGNYEHSFDALFGLPVYNSGSWAGDFGDFAPMEYYYDVGGCP